jgi:hypothetical protein
MSARKKRKIFSKKKNRYGTAMKWASGVGIGFLVCLSISLTTHLFRDSLSLIGLVLPAKSKSHQDTWDEYKKYFRHYSTKDLSPVFLAALAQTESRGSFVSAPRWTFNFKRGPFDLLSPDSSTFGIMGLTASNFSKMKPFCVTSGNSEVTRTWYQVDGCWFNFLSTRLSPANSIEHTAAFIQASVNKKIHGEGLDLSSEKVETFAALLHRCGVTEALKSISDLPTSNTLGLSFPCGKTDTTVYLSQVFKNKRIFEKIVTDSDFARN